MNLLDFYYQIKPLIPRRLQLALRRQMVLRKLPHVRHIWPIDPAAGKKPANWPGWPDNKQFALVLTHDVETAEGLSKVLPLARLEQSLGFHSASTSWGDHNLERASNEKQFRHYHPTPAGGVSCFKKSSSQRFLKKKSLFSAPSANSSEAGETQKTP